MGEELTYNRFCLFPSLEEIVRLINEGVFANAESGPYRI